MARKLIWLVLPMARQLFFQRLILPTIAICCIFVGLPNASEALDTSGMNSPRSQTYREYGKYWKVQLFADPGFNCNNLSQRKVFYLKFLEPPKDDKTAAFAIIKALVVFSYENGNWFCNFDRYDPTRVFQFRAIGLSADGNVFFDVSFDTNAVNFNSEAEYNSFLKSVSLSISKHRNGQSPKSDALTISTLRFQKYFESNKKDYCVTLGRRLGSIFPSYRGGTFGVAIDQVGGCSFYGPTVMREIFVKPELQETLTCSPNTSGSGSSCRAQVSYYCSTTYAAGCKDVNRLTNQLIVFVNSDVEITGYELRDFKVRE
ncbi:hypothetical protein [Zhengella mangrovi]|uniref:hypothetical protein n=1 Tax=Zhengella mangrovi TaxID=1982044 RepID=UPI0010568E5A|nr:hypothetical protein [Zhengella mangrovi]